VLWFPNTEDTSTWEVDMHEQPTSPNGRQPIAEAMLARYGIKEVPPDDLVYRDRPIVPPNRRRTTSPLLASLVRGSAPPDSIAYQTSVVSVSKPSEPPQKTRVDGSDSDTTAPEDGPEDQQPPERP
jgi:hypothetical protein